MMEIYGEIRPRHTRPGCVASALRPDNLQSMQTSEEGDFVITRIGGTSLRSVIASVDDYLMNLAVAEDLCSISGKRGTEPSRKGHCRPDTERRGEPDGNRGIGPDEGKYTD